MTSALVERRETFVASLDGVGQAARNVLAQHSHFRGRVDNFEFVVVDRKLLVRGRVPSFYLKQVLQTVLQDLAGIERIDNQVDVVSADGLSSLCGGDR
jgi:hypothetical protein